MQSVLPPALDAEDAAAMLQAHLPGTAKALKPTEHGSGGGSAVGGVVLLETVPGDAHTSRRFGSFESRSSHTPPICIRLLYH